MLIYPFSAVQHERAPRSNQTPIHHYPLGLSARFRPLPGSPIFSTLPLGPTLLEPPLTAHYLPQSLLYPGILGGFHKHNLGVYHSSIGESYIVFSNDVLTKFMY